MFYEFEKNTRDTKWSMTQMHAHSHYELYILLEGERRVFINNTLFTAKAYTAILIPPFVLHKTEGDKFSRINVNFSADYFSATEIRAFEKNLAGKVITVPAEKRNILKEILNELECRSAENERDGEVYTRCLTYSLIYILCRSHKTAQKDYGLGHQNGQKYPEILIKVLDHIDNNLGERLTVAELSARFYISESYLCKMFRKFMELPLSVYILHLRLTKAREYLTNTKKSIEEISALCGFSCANYFGLIFKRHSGLSPRNFRNHQRKKQS